MATFGSNLQYSRNKPTFNSSPSLIILFLLVIVVSVILTILTIHLNRLPNDYQLNLIEIREPIILNDGLEVGSSATKKALQNINLRNLSKIYKYNYIKLKNALQPPFVPFKIRKPGWKVLSGNVVVHEGQVDNPHNITYLVNSADACELYFKNTTQPKILIFVESDVENFERRLTIRQTWGLPMLQRTENVKIVFMLGTSSINRTDEVRNEFYTYGDVVQEDFKETFKHLTLKTVMGLKWAQTFCPQAEFIVKTDDDILLHIPNLVKRLQSYGENSKKLLLCHKNHSRKILRISKLYAKYQVSPFELPGSFFPEYCSGFMYIMSRDAVALLYEASTRTPYFFIEDVYVTGFCRYKADIQLIEDDRIILKPIVTSDSAPCDFNEGRITSHELTVQETRSIWSGLNTQGFFCPVLVNDISLTAKLRKRLKNANII